MELLPGNFAKLRPPEGQDLMDGLEVKVRLGSVWKGSLTELSGGQRCVSIGPVRGILKRGCRSLIALSLVMALCSPHPCTFWMKLIRLLICDIQSILGSFSGLGSRGRSTTGVGKMGRAKKGHGGGGQYAVPTKRELLLRVMVGYNML